MSISRTFLLCGAAAGPLYVVVGAIEALTRRGFDPLRQDLSLLSNGSLGWIHILLFILSGILTICGAAGARRVMAGGRGRVWAPLLLGLYGIGLIGAGIFTADPAFGFPPGTPPDAHTVSWHGMLHLICGAVGFVGLIAACFVFARRFSGLKRPGWTAFSIVTGALLLLSFMGITTASQQHGAALVTVIMAFTVAVVLSWTWLSSVMISLNADLLSAGGD